MAAGISYDTTTMAGVAPDSIIPFPDPVALTFGAPAAVRSVRSAKDRMSTSARNFCRLGLSQNPRVLVVAHVLPDVCPLPAIGLLAESGRGSL